MFDTDFSINEKMSDLATSVPQSTDLNSTASINNPEDKKDAILKMLQYDLEKHRMNDVFGLLKRHVIPEVLKNGSYIIWDLVPIICQRLRGLNEFRFKTFNSCRQILLDLCEICNPKELLIIYLSELENDLNIAKHSKLRDNDLTTNNNNENFITINSSEQENEDENMNQSEQTNETNQSFKVVDSNCFKALLKPLEVILLKLPKKRNETLKSVLSSLNEHISRLSLHAWSTFDFENDDRTKFLISPTTKNLNTVVSMYVDFLETFVKEVDFTSMANFNNNLQRAQTNYSKTSDPNIQRVILLKTLLRLLDYPLKYMDLLNVSPEEFFPKSNSENGATNLPHHVFDLLNEESFLTTRLVAVKVLRLISCLNSNFYTLLNRSDLITLDEVIASNAEFSDIYLSIDSFRSAISILCYLIATEPELSPSNFMPRVYTHIHNFGVQLPYVRLLLESDQFFIYDKGLELLSALLDHIKNESLEVKFLDLFRQYPVDKSLISIMVYSSSRSRREMALNLFKRLVGCFEPLGKYKILYSILSQTRQHAGFQGHVILMYKDILFENPIYQGSNLHRMIRSIISVSMPQEKYSDLIEKSDLIFSSLSLFRYILLRDQKSQNTTRIWDLIVVIKENFLKPLQEALDLSKTHYKMELCKLKELRAKIKKNGSDFSGKTKANKKRSSASNKTIELNVIENNQTVRLSPNTMAIEHEHKQILLALQGFDLIESILSRLREIIGEQQTTTSSPL